MARGGYRRRKSLSDITSEATVGPLLWILFICGGFMIAIPIALVWAIIYIAKEIYHHLR